MSPRLLLCCLVFAATPALARDALGISGDWAAFRDPQAPRCYAIAMAAPSTMQRDFQPFASVGWWPRQQTRGQLHFRLSRKLRPGAPVSISIGGQRVTLLAGAADAWAPDKRADAAIVAAMRSAREMTIHARDAKGRGFSNTYALAGAATAMDAAALGCAQIR